MANNPFNTEAQSKRKSVRWTGQLEHENPIEPSVPSGSLATNDDYFTYPNASGNQRPVDPYERNSDDSSSTTSSSESENSEEFDEHSTDRRATTRANTWFNRLRQQDDGDLYESDEDDEEEAHPQISASRNRHGPTSPVNNHDMNPYANIMDIGTKVSGGLAPGGQESGDHDDPIDEEYQRRRERLLSSLPSKTAVFSNDDHANLPDPLNSDAIPLSNMPSAPTAGPSSDAAISPFAAPSARSPANESSRHSIDELANVDLHDEFSSQAPDLNRKDSATKAEQLRRQLEKTQSERTHRMEEIIARRRKRQEPIAEAAEDTESLSKQLSDARRSSDKHSETDSVLDAENEELKRLEEAARQEAELQAKLLVKSHLNANLLSAKPDEQLGYVPNQMLDSALLEDDDLPPEDSEDERQRHSDKTNSKESATEKDASAVTEETSSGDTLTNEKRIDKDSKFSDDDSDSDSESDEENRNISLRGDPDYVPPPKQVKEGVLGSLLRLYAGQEEDAQSGYSYGSTTPTDTPSSTPLHSPSYNGEGYGASKYPNSEYSSDQQSYFDDKSAMLSPKLAAKRWKRPGMFRSMSGDASQSGDNLSKWLKRPSLKPNSSISFLASSGLAATGGVASNIAANEATSPEMRKRLAKPGKESKGDKSGPDSIAYMRHKEAKKAARKAEQERREREKAIKKARLAEQTRITVHIADVLQRQRFLLRLGRALMLFGAPSHRLEEYLKITSRVLEIDVQVLYIPGCLLFSFGDATTHTSETKLLKVTQGLNLQKLHSTHLIYKEVVHDLMSLEEASSHIDHLLRSKNIYPWYLVVFFYGLACVCCGMFAYGGLWKDMPIIFLMGCCVGFLQFWVQPKSDLYANVFEVSSSIVVSFVGRAFGSIGHANHRVFCFASIVQASLALILPGYIILVGALELQTKNLVAGSVRMFYANIYSLFLSFGITLGSAIYGWIDSGAVTETTCEAKINDLWKILFVPAATLFMAAVNQAGPRQLPIMVFIGSAGYTAQYFVQRKVQNASSFTSAIGAFTLGVLGNLYSRVGHGLAFAAMLPGIFVLVPSGVAAQGSLVAGVNVATQIVNSTHVDNSSVSSTEVKSQADAISELGNNMTQVAVGIVVGLFAATLVVYPLGLKKKRSGLFTF